MSLVRLSWKPMFQRSEYGLFIIGLRKVTAWPAKVSRPSELPEGWSKPVGKGLLSVASGVRELLLVAVSDVDWLKPSWLVSGLVENLSSTPMAVMVTGATNIPKPPRITVLPCRKPGVQATPKRGLTR